MSEIPSDPQFRLATF
jgi:GcrA cell cycle regulator